LVSVAVFVTTSVASSLIVRLAWTGKTGPATVSWAKSNAATPLKEIANDEPIPRPTAAPRAAT
jgi:hypothetical protein